MPLDLMGDFLCCLLYCYICTPQFFCPLDFIKEMELQNMLSCQKRLGCGPFSHLYSSTGCILTSLSGLHLLGTLSPVFKIIQLDLIAGWFCFLSAWWLGAALLCWMFFKHLQDEKICLVSL